MRLRVSRIPRVVLLVVPMSCASFQPGRVYRDSTEGKYPRMIRVMRNDQRVTELLDARVEGDSLVGDPGGSTRSRVAIALSDIQRVEEWRPDTGRSVALVVAIVVALAIVIGLALSELGKVGSTY